MSDFKDLDSLKISQDFGAAVGTKKSIGKVSVRKPIKQRFFRVFGDPGYRIETYVLEFKDRKEFYLVAPELRESLGKEISPRLVVTAVDKEGAYFLWPIKTAMHNGSLNAWQESELRAADRATKVWVRMESNLPKGEYETVEASRILDEPGLPAMSFEELLRIGFKDRYIDSLDHPILKELRGEF